MKGKLAKTCTYALVIALLAISMTVAANNIFALAQPCEAQLGSPNVSMLQYYGANFQVTVPVTATCPFYPGQLYATGTAYDTTYNANIGTAYTVLTSTYGGYGLTGQLTFTLPTSALSHSVQFSVSIYGTQTGYSGGYYGGTLLATASSTFVLGPSYYQTYPPYPTYPSYPTYPTYPSYPTYPTYPSYPTYPTHPSYPTPSHPSYPYHPTYPGYPYYPGYYYGWQYNNHQYCTRWEHGQCMPPYP